MRSLLAYFQYQALLLWLVLAAGWAWSGINRRRERLRRLGRATAAKPCDKPPLNSSLTGTGTRGRSTTTRCSIAASTRNATGNSHNCGYSNSKSSSSDTHGDDDGNAGGAGAGAGAGADAPTTRTHLPPVSVVMPVKGCRPHSLDNWESHLGLMYDGPLEFVFVVESEEDPAVGPLRLLCTRYFSGGTPLEPPSRSRPGQVKPSAHPPPTSGHILEAAPERAPNVSRSAQGRDVRLVVAGLASSCSQKVHNLCAGIESCDPRVARDGGYIMCLDDDVALHPGSLAELVSELEGRPHVFMATGYPFDIPPAGSSFTTYLALCYHLPLLIAFSVAPDTSFVWGGCMLLRAEKLLPEDPGELLAAWRHGGYSDDLILASYCTERRLGIRVPPFAVFPQKLDPRMGWAAWLNYLHRQLFVLDTYTNDHNRRTNHTMMVLHSVLSWLLVLPSLAALVTLVDRTVAVTAAVVAAAATGLATVATAPVEPTMAKAAGAEVGYCSVAFSGSGCGSSSSSRGLFSEGTAALLQPLLQLPVGVVAVVLGWAAAHSALVFMTAEILGLFRQLSPAAPAIPLSWFRWGRLWAAMLLSNAVLPLIMLYTYISPWVDWGGVVYRKHRGRVLPVRRRRPPSPPPSPPPPRRPHHSRKED